MPVLWLKQTQQQQRQDQQRHRVNNSHNNNNTITTMNNNNQPRISAEEFGRMCEEVLARRRLEAALAANNGQPVSVASVRGVAAIGNRSTYVPAQAIIPYEEDEVDKKDDKGKNSK